MPRKALTAKEKKFVEHYTNEKSKETYLNGKQSALKAYNATEQSAGQIAHVKLNKVEVIKAIDKKILKKEDIEEGMSSLVSQLKSAVDNNITVENVPLINQLGINLERSAKISGYLVDKQTNNYTQIVINGGLQSPFQSIETQDGGGGETQT